MEILEIQNPNEVRHLFEEIPFEKRVMPSIVMTFASSKGILLLIVNVILMSIVVSSNWIERKERANTQNFAEQRKAIDNENTRRNGTINSAFVPD